MQDNIMLLLAGLMIGVFIYLILNILNKNKKTTENTISKEVVPYFLQAHERMTLFLERIKPENLLIRVSPENLDAELFLRNCIQEVRNEKNHNAAQQVYIKPDTWAIIELASQALIADLLAHKLTGTPRDYILEVLKDPNLGSISLINNALLQLKRDLQSIV
ncbi:MAG: hypothetical protein ACRCVT_13060 [Leadbetterella sp.]